ncbi:hypothetical protein [Methylobacterium aerolatum]|uniref:Nitrate reductase n=1 Tax=Methylobacterium aerolatum TaxID=418708 RepID=A0ABU0HZK7_9HYPH|nr:hypothetical protein [Methylobacterium aerolatum]MDQ0447787.1 hypothetical protein [Methylobacterium aerolatum]GJD34885.1 hypothetical protein FMGBMHLM_1792 [Methylobacterium aerolatum]
MAFVSLKSFRARSAERAAVASALKATLRDRLGLGPDDALAVNEIACPDPGCPDQETIVLVMRAGRPTRALRVRAPMDAVTPDQIDALVAEEREPPTQA